MWVILEPSLEGCKLVAGAFDGDQGLIVLKEFCDFYRVPADATANFELDASPTKCLFEGKTERLSSIAECIRQLVLS